MTQAELTLTPINGETDPEALERLRRDLDEHVGPAAFAAAPAQEGAKGIEMALGSLVVSLMSAPGVAALVGVLKSHMDRNRTSEIEVSGPGGTIKLKLADDGPLAPEQIREMINRVLVA